MDSIFQKKNKELAKINENLSLAKDSIQKIKIQLNITSTYLEKTKSELKTPKIDLERMNKWYREANKNLELANDSIEKINKALELANTTIKRSKDMELELKNKINKKDAELSSAYSRLGDSNSLERIETIRLESKLRNRVDSMQKQDITFDVTRTKFSQKNIELDNLNVKLEDVRKHNN